MKKILFLSLFILAVFKLDAAAGVADTLKLKPQAINILDSLKQQLQLIPYDSLKAPVYTQIADQYLGYDTIVNRNRKRYFQTEALNYTMLALHNYSRYGDSLGLRDCFDVLAKVYYSQRKFAQAKWFNLQSASISRIKNDVPNLIASLIKLSAIKMEIKEYKLAMADLNEALLLTTTNRLFETEAVIQRNYGFLYNRMENYAKGEAAIKRADAIEESVRIGDRSAIRALQGPAYHVVAKKPVAPVVKKKALVAGSKKAPKNNLPKKLIAAKKPVVSPDSLVKTDTALVAALKPVADSIFIQKQDTLVSKKKAVVAAKKLLRR